jgi:tetratricopeptide (TPR) repeat protein
MDISYVHEQEPQIEIVPEPVNQKSILEKISFIILLVSIVLSPLVFLTTNYAPIDTAKNIVITFGILIAVIFYVISSIKARTLSFPKNAVTTSGLVVFITIIISALLSDNIQKSIIGQGFEVGTASFLCLLFISSLLVYKLVTKNKDRVMWVYVAITAAFIILSIFQIIRLFVDPSFLNFGVLTSATSTLIGKWYDFGIFAGIIFLLSFFSLRLLNMQKGMKFLLYVLFLLSLLILIIVNSLLIWFSIFIVIFGYGVYNFHKSKKSRISIFTIILLVVSLAFAVKGTDIAKVAGLQFNSETRELALPWQFTLDIASNTIKEKPFWGAGSNRFVNQYLINKPAVINSSDFWQLEFTNGFGFIPTFLVTGGTIGIIAWILFLIFFTRAGVVSLKRDTEESLTKFFSISTFLISSFLWLMMIVYSPTHVILFLTFVFTGLFISSIQNDKTIKIDSRNITLILSVITLLILIFWTLAYIKKTVSLHYFTNGIELLNSTDQLAIEKAEDKFKSALSWDKSDIYYQALAEIDIAKIQILAQQLQDQIKKDQKQPNQDSLQKLNSVIDEALQYSGNAILIDNTNYYNYISGARVSELALSLKINNAYESAKSFYSEALKYNPYNPSIYLSLARLEVSQGKFDQAQKYIGIALQIKQNYTEAIFLLSQIQVNNGQIKDAITSVQFAIQTQPNNSLLYFQLGLLQYNDKNYQGAVDALQKAIQINDQYANARYFLGLAYARLGKNPDAIIQFENLNSTNPENDEVKEILTNLKAGKSPFSDVKTPIDSKPEKRKTLPVKEKHQ